ncbi:MAG: hypothetical protein U0166_02160 [Acidobacteriota bacterium]
MRRQPRRLVTFLAIGFLAILGSCGKKEEPESHYQKALALRLQIEEGNSGLPRYEDRRYLDIIEELKLVQSGDRDYWLARRMDQEITEAREKLNKKPAPEETPTVHAPFDPSSVPTRIDTKPKRPKDQLDEHAQEGVADFELVDFSVSETPESITLRGFAQNKTENKVPLRITAYALDDQGSVLGESSGSAGPPVWPNDMAGFKVSFLAQKANDGAISEGEAREGEAAVQAARDRAPLMDFDPALAQRFRLELHSGDGLELTWIDVRQGFHRWEKDKKKRPS